jgi:tetratricopeptide (TPR) repeat protein
LQKIDGIDELATLPSHFVVHGFGSDFDESHGRFMDTAAVIKNLDLIISADTALVHIAGALGKPIWVLLPYTAEWRWLQERIDSPWYPTTMRLFRQQEPGKWESVIAAVANELKQLVMTNKRDYISLFKQAADFIKTYDYLSAIACYKKILVTHPTQINTLKNLAHILRYQGIMDEATYYYNQALQYTDDADLHYGLAESQLALGNFSEGWHNFEWRYKRSNDARSFDHNMWNGNTDLHNKTLLVRAEYGQGDTIQFIRYLPFLKARGATIIVEAQQSLISLLSLCPYIDHVVPICSNGIPPVAYDLQIPLMSLSERCKTEDETDIPCIIPYLFAQEELIHYWKEQIKNDHNFKIGICWDSSPYYETFKSPLSRKSVPLELFAQLAHVSSISLYSLQKMNGVEQIQNLSHKTIIHTFQDFDNTHGRFMDTAALITQLDLIITVDTSIAHLAGALGKPVWVLLPYVADWRWMINRTDSPWYPTMKLFRQQYPGLWQPVMDHIVQTLRTLVSTD